jgi:3-hydroxyacyl-CoA dehydrogenase / enoyl-CoA hydratase / 3-hydroxybutyryl-CoA epimerase
MKNFSFEIDTNNIAQIGFDVPEKSMNTISKSVMDDLVEIVEQIKSDANIKGAIIFSKKPSGFCAGADLEEIGANMAVSSLEEAFKAAFALNASLRALETCGKPVACAIDGLALGGGLEIALACHYRVMADDEKIKLGLPECKVGLMPGGGGTQRLPRIMGVQNAAPYLLEGKDIKPKDAQKLGIINEIVPIGTTIAACTNWIMSNPKATQIWDDKGYRVKDGPYTPAGIMNFIGGNAMIAGKTYGNYPAQIAILSAVYEGLQVPMDAALRIESRYFLKNFMNPQTQSMVKTLFVSSQALSKGANRPKGFDKYEIKKVAVIGAGMMGAGIAYQQAICGIETLLIDQSQEAADKGKAHCQELLKKQVSRKKMTQEKADAALALIIATTEYDNIKGADLVIEAVFENREIKADVTKRAEAQLAPNAVFGSNTSTLPITGLSEASIRPDNFIGIHFFSPVEKMPLVEIILGEKTTPETLAKSIDYVLKIKKTPIVVNDARGFYTSRCFSTYVQEGIEMLSEGYAPILIENVGRMTGMPVAPLAMSDEVALDLAYKIQSQTKKDLGDKWQDSAAQQIIETLVVKLERFGRKNKKGFYDYKDDGTKAIWAGLSEIIAPTIKEANPQEVQEMKNRLLYRQGIEAARCFEENVITDPVQADVGSIFGWGFAPYHGGVISMIDNIGIKQFVASCDALADKYGERFRPNALLRDMAAKNEGFYQKYGQLKRAA